MADWTQNKISACISILRSHDDYAEAKNAIEDDLDISVTSASLRSAFRRNGKKSPTKYLGENLEFGDEDEELDFESIEGEDHEDPIKDEFYEEIDLDPEEVEKEEVGITEANNYHRYDKEQDKYFTYMLGEMKKIDGKIHRAVKKLYSNIYKLGKERTINEITRITGWSRAEFFAYKTAWGWTHDSAPFSEHEMKEAFDNAEKMKGLKKDLAKMVDRELERFGKKYERRQLKKYTKRYFALMNDEINPFKEWFSKNSPRKEVKNVKCPEDFQKRYCVVAAPRDVHLGVMSTGGEIPVEQALVNSTKHLLKLIQTRRIGNPELVYFPVGSDFMHIDNQKGETANETSVDFDELPDDIKYKAVDLTIEIIDMWRKLAPVRLVLEKGNHDEDSSSWLLLALRSEYRQCDDVEVKINFDHRQYEQYGNNLFQFAHGRYQSKRDIAKIMAQEAPSMWGDTKWRYAVSGHEHQIKEEEVGVHHIVCPALSEESLWMGKNGMLEGTRSQAAYLFDYEGGHFSREMCKIDDQIVSEDMKNRR